MHEIGFVLLTHRDPPQAARLVRTLNLLFDHPPIVCHHDFSKCDIVRDNFSANVVFVEPFVVTAWGDFSLVRATLAAIEKMFSLASAPKWAVLLSGADYPIKRANTIMEGLNQGDFDAHLTSYLVNSKTRKKDRWVAECYRRYTKNVYEMPSLDRRLRYRKRMMRFRLPFYTKRTLPFSAAVQCYAGKQWFSINRRTAETITSFLKQRSDVVSHYQKVWFSDESFIQTAIGSDPALRINRNAWRYTDFPAGEVSPKVLRMADLPALLTSPHHFARKFDPGLDSAILDALDGHIGEF